MAELHYHEALIRAKPYLVENHEPTTINDLVNCMFVKDHLRDIDYQYINQTVHTKDKMIQFMDYLINSSQITYKQAYEDLIVILSEDKNRIDIPKTLAIILLDVISMKKSYKIYKKPFEMVKELTKSIQENCMCMTLMEILESLRTIGDRLDPSFVEQNSADGSTTSRDVTRSTDTNFMNVEMKYEYSTLTNSIHEGTISELSIYPNLTGAINEYGQTDLMISCKENNLKSTTKLLDGAAALLNYRDAHGRTAFMYAVMNGNVEIVDEFLSCEKIYFNTMDIHGLSAAWYMYGEEIVNKLTYGRQVEQFHWKIEETLRQSIADIKQCHEKLDWNKIDAVVRQIRLSKRIPSVDLLMASLLVGSLSIVKDILLNELPEMDNNNIVDYITNAVVGVEPNMLETLIENTVIDFSTLTSRQSTTIVDIVILINNKQISKTMLTLLTHTEVDETSKIVLSLQAIDVCIIEDILRYYQVNYFNKIDVNRNTVFMISCKYCTSGVVSAMLTIEGIDFKARNAKGETAFMLSCYNSTHIVPMQIIASVQFVMDDCDNEGCNNLMHACRANNVKAVEYLVNCRPNVDINAKSHSGRTALSEASMHGSDAVLRLVLSDPDVKVNATDVFGQTALMWACRWGNIEVVQNLLTHVDIDVNFKNIYDETAFMKVCRRGNTDIVALFRKMCSFNANAKNIEGETAFMLACQRGNTELVSCLLHLEDVDVNACSDTGETGFMFACKSGHTDIVSNLLQNSKIYHNATNANGQSAFMLACKHHKTDIITMLLGSSSFNLNVSTTVGNLAFMKACRADIFTFLLNIGGIDLYDRTTVANMAYMWACRWGCNKIVNGLLLLGQSDANARNAVCETALMWACRWGGVEIVKLLLYNHQVDIHATNKEGENAFMWACRWSTLDVVALLLARCQMNVNGTCKNGENALMWACSWGKVEVVASLLAIEATDIDATNADGETAFFLACRRGNLELINMLLGQDSIDVNCRNRFLETPLMWACRTGKINVARLLLKVDDTNVTAVNVDGDTALSWARRWGNTEITVLLLDRNNVDANILIHDGQTTATASRLLVQSIFPK